MNEDQVSNDEREGKKGTTAKEVERLERGEEERSKAR